MCPYPFLELHKVLGLIWEKNAYGSEVSWRCRHSSILHQSLAYKKHINMADTRKFQTAYINLLCISCTIAPCALDLSTSISSGFDESIPILGRVVFGFETRSW